MRTTKEVKQNKGITLIALVITIIVMLILVAVTITMAVNGGLFEQAGRAGTKTNEAVKAEQELGSGRIKIGGIWYDSLQDYVDGEASENQGNETGNEGEKPEGSQEPSTPEGGETPEDPVTPEEDEEDDDAPIVELSKIMVGDYISNYPAEYTNVVDLDNEKYTKWRVLSVDESGVKLISAGVPLSYKISATYNVSEEVTKLNSGFGNIAVEENSTNDGVFDLCGFDLGGGTTLGNVFDNNFTDSVRSFNRADISNIIGEEDLYGKYCQSSDVINVDLSVDLLVASESDFDSGFLTCLLMNPSFDNSTVGFVIHTARSIAVRPVVTLKPEVVFKEATTKINNTATYKIVIPKQS